MCILTAEVECNQCFLVACDVAGESLVTEVELGRDFRTFESGENLAKVVVFFHWRGEVNNWGPYKGKGGGEWSLNEGVKGRAETCGKRGEEGENEGKDV